MSFWRRITKRKETNIPAPESFSPPDNLAVPVYGPPMPIEDDTETHEPKPDTFSPADNFPGYVYGPPYPLEQYEEKNRPWTGETQRRTPVPSPDTFTPPNNLMCTVYGPPPVVEELRKPAPPQPPAPDYGWRCSCGYHSIPSYAGYCPHCGTRKGEASHRRYHNEMDTGAPGIRTLLCPKCSYGWREHSGGAIFYEEYCPLCGTKARIIGSIGR